ncbi:hypothetical protein C8J57DRAFT_688035 [Mycena rebaudengoi]|nr:hypothetical protein C8J57DRAFT_688035 [Mycena rebaudengoi]
MTVETNVMLWKRRLQLSRWLRCEYLPVATLDECDSRPPSTARVNTLPVELLGEIFGWSLGDWGSMTEDKSTLVLEPLILSHVCGHWRTVTITMPMLWTSIWVDRPRAAHIPMVQLWIERSRSCQLSIYLRQTDPKSFTTSDEHDCTDEILSLLIPHAHRWQTVDFTFMGTAQKSLLSLQPFQAVALEHVALQVDSWDTTNADLLQSIIYPHPSVRSIHVLPNTSQQYVPWKQLTQLNAELELTIDTCLGILSSCPSLSTATFTCSADPDWIHTPFRHSEKHLTLPSMNDLSINASRIDLAPLFERLVLPALRTLALDYRYVPRTTKDYESLHDLLERSLCNLKAFSLHEAARMRDDERHISYLKSPCMSSLTDLELKVDMADKIIDFLTFSAATDSQLPNLRDVVLSDCRGDHISDAALFQMLASRLPAPDSLISSFLSSADLRLRLNGHPDPFLFAAGFQDLLELRLELPGCLCVTK